NMTRTKQTPPQGASKNDRHLQRNGLTDPRGMPKKEGAGQHNWGKPVDEFVKLETPQHKDMDSTESPKVK
ncbi:6397_t:CDS:2, partial [Acaulospora morrowiae]